MNWDSFPWGAALTFVGLAVAVTLLAMDERNRRKFLTREDATGMSKRIDTEMGTIRHDCERTSGLFVSLDDRVGILEGQATKLEERQSQQWERISEQMAHTAETIREVTKELKDISRMQQEHALRLERLRGPDTT